MSWHDYWLKMFLPLMLISSSPLLLMVWFWWKRNQKGEDGQYMDKLKAMQEDDRIFYRREGESLKRRITIYRGMLTEEQKQQLEAAEKTLFDLADDVEEEQTRKVKGRKD
jgi:hypothetical protein